MRIYIPTLGRQEQATFVSLPAWAKRITTLVCGVGEKPFLVKKYGCTVWERPAEVKGIGAVRNMIMKFSRYEKIIMLDDDLKFAIRNADGKLVKPTEAQLTDMFHTVHNLLDQYAHGSISSREGNNHVKEDMIEVSRPQRVLAYNRMMVKETGAHFRVRIMEDFDMTLQLLRKGYANFVIYNYCHDQAHGSGATGGCSGYRTPEVQAEAARLLHSHHPDFVTIVEKETKTAWKEFGGKRVDVRVAWKKAFKSAL
jgi:hypothetical protein